MLKNNSPSLVKYFECKWNKTINIARKPCWKKQPLLSATDLERCTYSIFILVKNIYYWTMCPAPKPRNLGYRWFSVRLAVSGLETWSRALGGTTCGYMTHLLRTFSTFPRTRYERKAAVDRLTWVYVVNTTIVRIITCFHWTRSLHLK